MSCPNCKEMLDAILAVDKYFRSLCDQWQRHDGRLASESGAMLAGSKRTKRLCDIAGEKVGIIAERYRQENKT